jgi:hypothetical protein
MRHRRALRRYRRAAEAYRVEQARWDRDASELRGQLGVVKSFAGATVTDEPQIPLRLHPGERVFSVLQGVALAESRRAGGHWEGGHSGFSFRVARGVRWNVGATKGRNVKGEERPTVIDSGTATVTDRRVVFQGPKQSREWDFDKLLGYRHASPEPMTSFQVEGRERVSGLVYDQDQAPEVHFRLALAMAHHKGAGAVAQLERHLEAELAAHERDRPPPPELPPKVRTALRHER